VSRPVTSTRSRRRVLVIYKKSMYQVHVIERKNRRLAELVAKRDRSVRRLLQAHREHLAGIELARKTLAQLGAQAVFRYRREAGTAEAFDLVVTLGGDGTLLWASHIVGADVPMIAINTAPKDSVGHFCAATRSEIPSALEAALNGSMRSGKLTRMKVTADGETVTSRVLNDVLFCHASPAATARYWLKANGTAETHKSSGVWAGPAAGSTAAQRSAGGRVLPPASKRLQYIVREPYDMTQSPEPLTLLGFRRR
jgi:NAD+ kinase